MGYHPKILKKKRKRKVGTMLKGSRRKGRGGQGMMGEGKGGGAGGGRIRKGSWGGKVLEKFSEIVCWAAKFKTRLK